MLKLNISFPTNSTQKQIMLDNDLKEASLYELKISDTFEGEKIDENWAGYVFKITGGSDNQGFPMMQGVLTPSRVRILFKKGMINYTPKKRGERKRRSVRGCIVSSEISVLNVAIVKKGSNEIEGLTDKVMPRKYGPKRASRIRKLFNLSKEDDVTKYAVPVIKEKNGKQIKKYPRITRLMTEKKIAGRLRQKEEKQGRKLKQLELGKAYLKKIAAGK